MYGYLSLVRKYALSATLSRQAVVDNSFRIRTWNRKKNHHHPQATHDVEDDPKKRKRPKPLPSSLVVGGDIQKQNSLFHLKWGTESNGRKKQPSSKQGGGGGVVANSSYTLIEINILKLFYFIIIFIGFFVRSPRRRIEQSQDA